MKPHIYKHNGTWYARGFDIQGTQRVGFDVHHNTPAFAYSALIDSIEEANDLSRCMTQHQGAHHAH